MKFEENFNDITILMLTHNRPETLLRNLSFINSYGIKIKIIILDSSSRKISTKLFNNFNLDIIHLKFSDTFSTHKKIYFSLKYIKSKFCLTMADDDFFFINSIHKCLDFLRKKISFASAYGYVFLHSNFSRTNKGLFLLYKLDKKNIKSNLSDNNKIRIKNFISGKIAHNYYSVCRANIFKKTQRKIYYWSKGQGTGEFDELLYSVLILNYGKSKFLKIPYSSREPNHRSSSLFNPKLFDESYKKWNLKFVKIVSNLLKKKEKKTFEKYLLKIMSKRLAFLKNRENLNNNISLFYFFKWFLLVIKRFFITNIYSKKYYGIDFPEIKKIRKFITKFPNVQNEIKKSRLLRKKHNLLF